MKRYVLIIVGWLCVGLGIAGTFLPLLPTTVFILIAASCFMNSSERFHEWLYSHPQFGVMVRAWENGDGIPKKVRNRAIITLWVTLIISMLLIAKLWTIILLVLVGVCVSGYLISLPELKSQPAGIEKDG